MMRFALQFIAPVRKRCRFDLEQRDISRGNFSGGQLPRSGIYQRALLGNQLVKKAQAFVGKKTLQPGQASLSTYAELVHLQQGLFALCACQRRVVAGGTPGAVGYVLRPTDLALGEVVAYQTATVRAVDGQAVNTN